jgi:hypothetical protein
MGELRASADVQTATAARREEGTPKVKVLQSRLARAAAAFWRWRVARAEFHARRAVGPAVDRPIGFSVFRFKNSRRRVLSKQQRAP